MPELPEVENIKISLKPIIGQSIGKVLVLQPKTVSGKGNLRRASSRRVYEFVNELTGETIKEVGRRGKNLLIKMRSGKIILVHLKMTGQFLYDPTRKLQPGNHTRIFFGLSKGNLLFNDMRRFGYVLYFPNLTALKDTGHFEKLGAEPLDKEFSSKYLWGNLQKNKANLKSVLMGQKVVAGLGNIYTDEALFASGIYPLRKANSLSKEEAKNLHRAIKDILKKAVKLGGSSVRNYKRADGSVGNYASEHYVYGKAGQSCFRCGTVLKSFIVAGRTTVACGKCQK